MTGPIARSDDEQAIRNIEQMWDDAWNRHDAQALAGMLSEDVDFVNVTGAWFKVGQRSESVWRGRTREFSGQASARRLKRL